MILILAGESLPQVKMLLIHPKLDINQPCLQLKSFLSSMVTFLNHRNWMTLRKINHGLCMCRLLPTFEYGFHSDRGPKSYWCFRIDHQRGPGTWNKLEVYFRDKHKQIFRSQHNAAKAICPATVQLLQRVLLSSSDHPIVANIVLRCEIAMVHALLDTRPDQVQLDQNNALPPVHPFNVFFNYFSVKWRLERWWKFIKTRWVF